MTGGDPLAGAASGAIEEDLTALAAAHGVATAYTNWAGRQVQVAANTVQRVLGVLGVEAATPAAVRAGLREAAQAPWRRLVPPTVVVTAGEPARVVVHVPTGGRPVLTAHLEDGRRVALSDLGPPGERRTVDGQSLVAVPVRVPELPLGWHQLRVQAADRREDAVLVVAPGRVSPSPDPRRAWGWMVQLYGVRSRASWGMGDYADLAALVAWSGSEAGGRAGLLLCNPLHACAPVLPVQPSPYYPASRRFRSPLYLRIEDTPEYAAVDPATRARVDALRVGVAGDRIERDAVWRAKSAAWELLFPARRRDELASFRASQGRGLEDFGLFCALAERHGTPWQDWPEPLRRADSAAAGLARAGLAERVELHAWLQLLCDEQLASAQAAATGAGMAIGVVHDLAVGVDPGGSDGWALQDDLALGVTVGAPPDSFNQRGQDWRLPPWRPDRLAASGYAAYRDMLAGVLRHAGGLRLDHVMGLFRLWWVPAGEPPDRGTYVHYDARALLGVLCLAAHRAGALVVGEDLGTVEPEVTAALAERGVLGSAVLWFERDDDQRPLPPARWPEPVMASVSTHDLPTAAGFLSAEHVRVRHRLGQLARPLVEEHAQANKERAALVELLCTEGLVDPDADDRELALAMYALLARTPARLVLAALGDAVGDRRQPNLPGTTGEYPNWQLPVARPGPRPLLLEDLLADDGVLRLARLLHRSRPRP